MKKLSKKDQKWIEDCTIKSAENMGAPKDMWVEGYGRVMIDGELTPLGRKWYEDCILPKQKK